jgi:hypothetical protein
MVWNENAQMLGILLCIDCNLVLDLSSYRILSLTSAGCDFLALLDFWCITWTETSSLLNIGQNKALYIQNPMVQQHNMMNRQCEMMQGMTTKQSDKAQEVELQKGKLW